jgi:hypothetical protein
MGSKASTYKSSRRYGAEVQEAFNPTFIEGLAETHKEWRYVDASRAPVRLHGKLRTLIVLVWDNRLGFGKLDAQE